MEASTGFCCGTLPLQAVVGHFEKGFGICETEKVSWYIKLERNSISPERWREFDECELYLEPEKLEAQEEPSGRLAEIPT